jgi:oxygen-independent coproporphyrinogen-3 oxidase
MFPLTTVPFYDTASVPVHANDAQVLRDRLRKPQRHRLLHGYPLAAAMRRRDPGQPAEDVSFDPHAGRDLLVGVLPHPFCNPALTGCGFCTFPHERYHAGRASEIVEHVIQEIDGRLARQPGLARRRVPALYIGGGTANLTPADSFRRLCRRLAAAFDLSQAEVTLEGVPVYFLKRHPLLLDVLREELPARHYRLSMGIQAFDEQQLRRMGRLTFGTAITFERVVERGHRKGYTVSADLLFNLPGQDLVAMRQDVGRADAIGLDHLGLYHLVMFRGLGTAWSRDPNLLAGLPSNEEAADNWLALRDELQGRGFHQTTLTNFERTQFRGNDRRFVYEEYSFQPDRFEMLGFGPSAISFLADGEYRHALKVLNPDGSGAYREQVGANQPVWDRYYEYGPRDLRVFHLTRSLAALAIDRRRYRSLFGTDPVDDFPRELGALAAEELVEIGQESIRPTARGMFFADSIAALLAWRQVLAERSRQLTAHKSASRANDNSIGYM